MFFLFQEGRKEGDVVIAVSRFSKEYRSICVGYPTFVSTNLLIVAMMS